MATKPEGVGGGAGDKALVAGPLKKKNFFNQTYPALSLVARRGFAQVVHLTLVTYKIFRYEFKDE